MFVYFLVCPANTFQLTGEFSLRLLLTVNDCFSDDWKIFTLRNGREGDQVGNYKLFC